jgi:dTDP-4-amino-4,6-dideoxygalactose transaminase
MSVPFFTLTRQYAELKAEIDSAVSAVLAQGHFIMGPQVQDLEKQLEEYLGTKHVVSVANGTDALVMALDALGIDEGDEVITTPYTFFASAECISHHRATPVFADVDPITYDIDPNQIRKAITPRTKAIIPVHIFGNPCNMDEIMKIAREHNLFVLEDCAQAIGATYRNKHVGTIGDIGTYSLFPTKNLGCYGDGGFIATNNDDYAAVLRKKRTHGSSPKYYHSMIGYNSRLDTIQAAIVLAKLPHLDAWNIRRREVALHYNEAFAALPVRRPFNTENGEHIYHLYMLGVPNRDLFKEYLDKHGIGNGIYYPLPLHLQEVYKPFGFQTGTMPVAEMLAPSMLALPCYPEITDAEISEIIKTVVDFF